ncbi:unnamed protein product [Diplocarpon coronariae]
MVTWPERISGLEDAPRGPSSPAGRCRGHGRPDILEPCRGPGDVMRRMAIRGTGLLGWPVHVLFAVGIHVCSLYVHVLVPPAQGSVGPPVQYTAVAHSTVQQHRTTPHRPPSTIQPVQQLINRLISSPPPPPPSPAEDSCSSPAIGSPPALILARRTAARLRRGARASRRAGTSGPGSRGSSRARGPRAGPGAALPRSRPRLIATTTLEQTLERPMDSASTRGEIEKEADAVRWGPGAGRRDRVRLPGWRGGLGRRGEGRGGGCLGICCDGAGRLDGRAGLYIEGWSTSVALQMRRPESPLDMGWPL